MRKSRLKAPPNQPVAYYHCTSRIIERKFLLEAQEKQQFLEYMRLYEDFCSVRVVSYCLMSNHFHIVLEVTKRPEVLPTDEELFAKLGLLYRPAEVNKLRQRLAQLTGEKAAAFRERYFRRMWDVSQYMKALKQRFTQWYNLRNDRKGTLWEDRFGSVIIESAGKALGTITGYVDLNPIRAGIAKEPEAYRWSGYGAALGGNTRAQEGYRIVMQAIAGKSLTMKESLAAYRVWLYNQGREEEVASGLEGQARVGTAVRLGISRQKVEEVVNSKGQLNLREYLQCRVRYFTAGVVIGSRAYVEEVFQGNRDWFGQKRKTGARPLRYLAGEELYSVRDFRKEVMEGAHSTA